MWIPLAFASAFFDSLQNSYFKHTAVQVKPILMAWSVLVISGICYAPLLLLGVPHLTMVFWFAVIVRLVIDSVAFTLFITGVQESPLSLTIPMMALSPILSVGTVYVLSHLLPSPIGFLGILVTVGGIYFLHFDHDTKHILSPFRAVAKDKGVQYVTVAAVLWSLVSALQKVAIDHSNYYFYTASFQIIWAVCFTPIAYLAERQNFLALFRPKTIVRLLPGGVLDAVKVLVHNAAFATTIPAYVNSVGNTSILFTLVLGALFFKEKISKHAVPIVIIFVGITLLVFGQK